MIDEAERDNDPVFFVNPCLPGEGTHCLVGCQAPQQVFLMIKTVLPFGEIETKFLELNNDHALKLVDLLMKNIKKSMEYVDNSVEDACRPTS